MIRLVILLVALCSLAFGAAILADDPGSLKLEIFGYAIETTGFVALAALLALAVLAVILFMALRWIWLTPHRTRQILARRRTRRGFEAVSRGIIAVGAGDLRSAQRQALEAEKISPKQPLTLLLRAQAAQMAGDRTGAESAFRAMLEEPETKVLGLRGLYVEAQRRQDAVALKAIAEEAVKAAPSAAWAANALLEHHAMSGDWPEALKAVERNATAGLLTRPEALRARAVLLAAEAMKLGDDEAEKARTLALEANRLAPDLVPAAELAARLLGQRGDVRRASRIIEAAWQANPHPELAATYAQLRHGDSMLDRLKRIRTLVGRKPAKAEGHLALARAALDAGAWDEAKAALAPLMSDNPTQRAFLLMAELAAKQDNDHNRAREWMAKALRAPRDPAWTADGYVCEHWLPASPISGRLDAFEWKVPLAQIGGPILHVDDVLADTAEPVAITAPTLPPALPPAAMDPAVEEPAPPPPFASTALDLEHRPDDPGIEEEVEKPRKRTLSFFRNFG